MGGIGTDGWIHVDPNGKEKALIMLFNPTKETMSKELVIPPYYTGLNDKASISVESKNQNSYVLNQNQEVILRVDIPTDGNKWLVVE